MHGATTKTISLCCKWHKSLFVLRQIQNTQIQCGQRVQLLNVKPVGASRNQWALEG